MEILRRVKQGYPDVQVIILTGYGSEKDEQEARPLGAFEYLQKPVDIARLVEYTPTVQKSRMPGSFDCPGCENA